MNITTDISVKTRLLGGLWGALVGDALGVPVEFTSRATLQANPVTTMREYGTHHQPRGTWSDDGSLLLCSADSLLTHEFDLQDMGERFARWMNEGLWTAYGEVFDIGRATAGALRRIAQGIPAVQAGDEDVDSNGNGSLMRILPVVLRFAAEPLELFADRVEQASAVTHGHARSRIACVFYGLVVRRLLLGRQSRAALDEARLEFRGRYGRSSEFSHFRRILEEDLVILPKDEVLSTGYVLDTLRASLWCLLTTSTFPECVLTAVNLGGDTDTTGCVAGGLAGVAYGVTALPPDWIGQLARKGDVDCLFHEFAELCESTGSKSGAR